MKDGNKQDEAGMSGDMFCLLSFFLSSSFPFQFVFSGKDHSLEARATVLCLPFFWPVMPWFRVALSSSTEVVQSRLRCCQLTKYRCLQPDEHD